MAKQAVSNIMMRFHFANYSWSLGYLNQYILTWRCDMLVNWLVIKFAGTVRGIKGDSNMNIHLGNTDVTKDRSRCTFSYQKKKEITMPRIFFLLSNVTKTFTLQQWASVKNNLLNPVTSVSEFHQCIKYQNYFSIINTLMNLFKTFRRRRRRLK